MSSIHTFFQPLRNVFSRTQDKSSLSPVGQAIQDKKYKKALALIQAGAAVQIIERNGSNNFLGAIHHLPKIDLIQAFLSRADKGAVNYIHETLSPLMEACWSGHADIAQLLIAEGADVHASNKYQYTPLMFAVMQGVS